VLSYIGWRHEHDHRQLVEIHRELNEKGIEINERNVGKLYRQFLALLGATSEQAEEKLAQSALEHGGVVWAIDGLQPEGHGGLLYVLYEALSGQPVSAIQLESGTEKELVEWLKAYSRLPFKALATLSDGEKAIIAALKHSWPKAVHQRCQLHFLNNLAAPVLKVDTQLRKFMYDDLGEISAVPDQTESAPSPEQGQAVDRPAPCEMQPRDRELMAIESQIRRAVRDALHHKSRKPFYWAGLTGYQQLEAIDQALANVPADEPETAYLHRIATQVKRAVEKNRTLADDLKQAYQQLHRIADCLGYPQSTLAEDDSQPPTPQPTSQQIAQEMQTLMAHFQPDHKRQKAQSALYRAWHRTWHTFGADLLHCYDIPGLPADNLRMEALFGRLRRRQRRINGRKSTSELRNFGHCQVLFLADSRQELLQQMQVVPIDSYLQHRRQLAEAEKPRQFLDRLHRDPLDTVTLLVEQHNQRRQQITQPLPSDTPDDDLIAPTDSLPTSILAQYGNLKRTVPAFIRKLFSLPSADQGLFDALPP